MPDARQVARQAIAQWRDKLVNLTGTNRLLRFRVTKSSTLAITQPPLPELLGRLQSGREWEFVALRAAEIESEGVDEGSGSLFGAIEGGSEGDFVPGGRQRVEQDPKALGANHDPARMRTILRTLLTNANRTFLDTGMWALYLAVGTLTWNEPDDPETFYTSPLILIPVGLKSPGPRTPPTMTLGEDDPLVNPALQLKLALQDASLPAAEDLSLATILQYVERVGGAVRSKRGWRVDSPVYLTYLTFHKEAMYRDLDENVELILESELVTALANAGRLDSVTELAFDPVGHDQIDEVDPPERAVHVLDADASQRAAVVAARDGRSFVLDGPPGTGKSQTIANIIATLIAQGQSILFVSEKIAALEVVKNRLEDVGLGTYVLELHSDKTTRKQVAATLAAALQSHPRASTHMRATDRQEVERLRQDLSDYAHAMNRVREPLGVSLHDALGIVAQRESLPATKACSGNLADLTPADLALIRQAAERLSRCWRVKTQGEQFLWKEITTPTPILAEITAAEGALQELQATLEPYRDVLAYLGWQRLSDAQPLVILVQAWLARAPMAEDQWLTGRDLESVRESTALAANLVSSARRAIERAHSAAGPRWEALPTGNGDALPLEIALSQASNLGWPLTGLTAAEAGTLEILEGQVRQGAQLLEQLQSVSAELAESLGLLAPSTLKDVDAVGEIETLSRSAHRPERDWLITEVDSSVEQAIALLEQANAQVALARGEAEPYFRSTVLDIDPEGLAARFANVHRGLRKLGAAYRVDVRLVAEASTPGVRGKDNIANLDKAIAWLHAMQQRTDMEAQHAAFIGPRYLQEETDWAGLKEALCNARTIAELARAKALDTLMGAVAHGSRPDPRLKERHEELSALRTQFRSLLGQTPLCHAASAIEGKTLTELVDWFANSADVVDQLRRAMSIAGDVMTESPTVGAADEAWRAALQAQTASAQLREAHADLASILGQSFQGLDTDLEAMASAVSWAGHVRDLVGGGHEGSSLPLSEELIAALNAAFDASAVTSAWERWLAARTELVGKFGDSRTAELTDVLDHADEADSLLAALLEDSQGQELWFGAEQATDSLAPFGLAKVIEHMAELGVEAEQVPDIVEREVWRRWADLPLQKEPALRNAMSSDRDQIVAKFRELDRSLVLTAVGNVINEANRARPSAAVGQGSIILAEGQKKARHLPIRQLIERTQDVTQKIKPVFMMSPLSVSQFLTPNITFDAVIFDEASQVMPEDAVNCIYRGRQLIIAGDDKQLPPTNFFALADDGDGAAEEQVSAAQDFESILGIAKGSGAFTSLTLQWHYRSRHENLIAFSNRKFYGGNLITFPSTEVDGPHVGVEYFHVTDGVYERSGTRRNLVEARFVADRVEYHFDHRPGRTLGVVAFSVAQAEAIEGAVDELRDRRPDLVDALAGTSRLDGFFVKNLENVQGDERDVMIFSVGYGPDENRKFTMNFGPINKDGGWRRLNVAVTRARYRNEVVASFHPGDMQSGGAGSVAALRAYLDYAVRGPAALEMDDASSMGDPESPFEESVLDWLRGEGYEVVTQVGASGYRIDMAVRDPRYPSRYLIGVECDGKAYHSSRAARDRDRLRESVLRGLGWRLHRIWGTAWYRHRLEEQRRLLAAIDDALRAPTDGLLAPPTGEWENGSDRAVVDLVSIDPQQIASWVKDYVVAKPTRPPRSVDASLPSAVPHLRRTIEEVVTVESPVHMSVVDARIRSAWGIGRISHRVRPQIDRAIASAKVEVDGDFLYAGSLEGSVATRRHNSESKREISQIHRREIEDTAYRIVLDSGAVGLDELIVVTARYLGFDRVGPDVRNAIESSVRQLQELEWITADDDERIRLSALEEDEGQA